ncbi:MAG: hypothetical protein ACE5I7_19285 [Candidatus Binatia bacterium]
MDARYLVGIDGSPAEEFSVYETLEAAQEAALRMAKEMAARHAEEFGDRQEIIGLYDGSGEKCSPSTILLCVEDCGGASPEGAEAGYWPCIYRL